MRSICTSIVAIASCCSTGTSLGEVWPTPTQLNGEASTDYFGSSVAIDGDTCVIGAIGTNSYAGSAYIYTSDASGTWSQVAAFNGQATNDAFGTSVAIDGDTCVIGAYGTNSNAGSAYVYRPDTSGTWSQVAQLQGEASDDTFGGSVAIDGDTCVIGANGTTGSTGSAYVYTSDASGNWNQVAAFNGQAAEDNFGNSVAIEGDACVIAAYTTNSQAGSVYGYTSDASGTWSQVAQLNGEAGPDTFGNSVAIDGDTCVIGVQAANFYTGSAWVYGSTASATGACCYNGLCFSITEQECNNVGGTYAADPCSADTSCPASCSSDSDNDGDVDIEDLLNLIGAFGACP